METLGQDTIFKNKTENILCALGLCKEICQEDMKYPVYQFLVRVISGLNMVIEFTLKRILGWNSKFKLNYLLMTIDTERQFITSSCITKPYEDWSIIKTGDLNFSKKEK